MAEDNSENLYELTGEAFHIHIEEQYGNMLQRFLNIMILIATLYRQQQMKMIF